jgi:hypothetical protein
MEVELDIFSGNPNPTWVLPSKDAGIFLQKISALPRASAKKLSNNLGYRGFVVHVTQGKKEFLVRVQTQTVQVVKNHTTVYYNDPDRNLERWLLETGKPFLKHDLFVLVQGELTR